ncbi:MspA protein [Mycobacterium sp. ACS1612]|uniref:MspA family porin n=1 Tax=Mycobacterium sp. ACS1612 TaxID=1834117 RepID=UPI00080166FC|nr:MspA protein [Mycobacterium sp. ACS1612]
MAVLTVCALLCASAPPSASADPDTEAVAAEAAAPADEGWVESSPPATTIAPDGWTQTVSAKNELQRVISPLTTAVSSREYQVGGTYSGALSGPEDAEPPSGTLEVGYQIGCGIDMSTSNGVSLTGTVGLNPSVGVVGTDVISPLPEGIIPGVGSNLGGGVTVGLKPGLINTIPVSKKQFRGFDPWILIDGFRIKIDGCVGESFIRSYSFLTRSTDVSDVVTAWYGVTKKV